MTVRERYPYTKIAGDVKELVGGGSIKTRIYNPYSRETNEGPLLSLEEKHVLVIEGVPTLDIKGLRDMAHIRIYYDVDEAERKRRFSEFYQWKNMTEPDIEQLYKKRMKDELPLIRTSRKYANVEILDDGKRIHIRS